MSTIYIRGEINDESFVKFARSLARQVKSCKTAIDVHLISDGGSATAALAFFDLIQSCPYRVHMIGHGSIASAAVLILAAGHYRTMHKNAWVMVHEDSADALDGLSVAEIERESKHLRTMETQWNRLLANVTTTPEGIWEQLHKATTYLSAEECLKLGLIEEIV